MAEKKEKKQSSADEKEAQAWNKTLQKRMKAAREAAENATSTGQKTRSNGKRYGHQAGLITNGAGDSSSAR